jgi:lipid II:glycine glycyltransferase (peptidoglycan interpeptide bridge formation enzyme)
MTALLVRKLPDPATAHAWADAWEGLVQRCPESGFMQSLAWARVKQAQGLQVVHLGLFDGETLVGGAIAFTLPQPTGATLLISPEGPVLPWSDPERAGKALRALLEAMASEAGQVGAIAWRIEPRVAPPRPDVLRGFGRAPIDLVPQQTLYLDLTADDETLLAAMHAKGRYNIRLAGRRGVTVRTSLDPADTRRFYDVVVEAAQRDDFFVEPPGYFSLIAETLMPQGLARYLFAEHEGETLGALLLVTHGDRATYFYGGTTNDKRPLMAGYALQWAAIRQAREQRCRQYDFFGFEPHGDPDHLYAGFSRFKRQFGGEAVRFIGAQDHLFVDRLADAVVRAFQEIGSSL